MKLEWDVNPIPHAAGMLLNAHSQNAHFIEIINQLMKRLAEQETHIEFFLKIVAIEHGSIAENAIFCPK